MNFMKVNQWDCPFTVLTSVNDSTLACGVEVLLKCWPEGVHADVCVGCLAAPPQAEWTHTPHLTATFVGFDLIISPWFMWHWPQHSNQSFVCSRPHSSNMRARSWLTYCSETQLMWEQSAKSVVVGWRRMLHVRSWCYMWCPDENTMLNSGLWKYESFTSLLPSSSEEKVSSVVYLWCLCCPVCFSVYEHVCVCVCALLDFVYSACQQVDQQGLLQVTITCLLKHCISIQRFGLQNGGAIYNTGLQ